jgi:exopolysaccharide biosynthesis polyprenyl glycosylphosphotransferase
MIRFKTPSSPTAYRSLSDPAPRRRATKYRQVLSEPLFHDAIIRERKRADRFEDAFAIVLIAFDKGCTTRVAGQLAEIVARLRPGADVIGWFEQDAVLGLIRSTSLRDARATTAALHTDVHHAVNRVLPADDALRCAIHCEMYPARSERAARILLDATKPRPTASSKVREVAKRTLDIAGSTAFLVAFGPVFLCVAAAVKLTSKGPVFFQQERIGEAGQPFTMFKFRTMQANADPRIHQEYVEKFIQSNQAATSGNGAVFKLVNDPRVTPVGDFLRRSSLDELPQFWNVLRGDMSLVGPRPPLPYEVARYKTWHRRRVLEAKPGITGLWQVTGRSRTTFDEMVRLDLRYARTYSVWTDLNILLATPKAVLGGKGAR